jgi:hypothetical protein
VDLLVTAALAELSGAANRSFGSAASLKLTRGKATSTGFAQEQRRLATSPSECFFLGWAMGQLSGCSLCLGKTGYGVNTLRNCMLPCLAIRTVSGLHAAMPGHQTCCLAANWLLNRIEWSSMENLTLIIFLFKKELLFKATGKLNPLTHCSSHRPRFLPLVADELPSPHPCSPWRSPFWPLFVLSSPP